MNEVVDYDDIFRIFRQSLIFFVPQNNAGNFRTFSTIIWNVVNAIIMIIWDIGLVNSVNTNKKPSTEWTVMRFGSWICNLMLATMWSTLMLEYSWKTYSRLAIIIQSTHQFHKSLLKQIPGITLSNINTRLRIYVITTMILLFAITLVQGIEIFYYHNPNHKILWPTFLAIMNFYLLEWNILGILFVTGLIHINIYYGSKLINIGNKFKTKELQLKWSENFQTILYTFGLFVVTNLIATFALFILCAYWVWQRKIFFNYATLILALLTFIWGFTHLVLMEAGEMLFHKVGKLL